MPALILDLAVRMEPEILDAVAKQMVTEADNINLHHSTVTELETEVPCFGQLSILTVDASMRSDEDDHRFQLQYIVKDLPEDNHLRAFVKRQELFAREATAYKEVIDELQKARARKENINLKQLCIPVCFSPSVANQRLVLEDLSLQGFDEGVLVFHDYHGLEGFWPKLIIEQLASLHASSFLFLEDLQIMTDNVEDFQDGVFHRASVWESSGYGAEIGRLMESHSLATAIEIVRRHAKGDAGRLELVSRMSKLAQKLEQVVRRAEQGQDAKVHVLVHGQPGYNNFMFKTSATRQVQNEVAILDFQTMRMAPAAFDLVHFLATSTSPEYRQANWKHIYGFYNHVFVRDLALMNRRRCQRIYTIDQLKQDVKDMWPYAFVTALWSYQCEHLDSYDKKLLINTRHTKTMLEEMSKEAVVKAHRNSEFKDRIILLAREAVELNAI